MKNRKWIWIGGALVVLIIIGTLAGGDDPAEAVAADSEQAAPEEEAAASEASAIEAPELPGIGVEREELTRQFGGYPYDVEFENGVDSLGTEVYQGEGDDLFMQIRGPEDDVHKVWADFYMTGGSSDHHSQKLRIIALLSNLGGDETSWARDLIDRGGFDAEGWGDSKQFGGNKVTLSFDPDEPNRPLTVLIEPAS